MDKNENDQTYWSMYSLIRQEMSQHYQDVRKIQIFAIFGIGAAYAYLFTSATSGNPSPVVVWFFIPVMVIFAWQQTYSIAKLRRRKVLYLREKIEVKLFDGLDVPGWETYFNESAPNTLSFMKVYWPAMFIVSLGIALSRLC